MNDDISYHVCARCPGMSGQENNLFDSVFCGNMTEDYTKVTLTEHSQKVRKKKT